MRPYWERCNPPGVNYKWPWFFLYAGNRRVGYLGWDTETGLIECWVAPAVEDSWECDHRMKPFPYGGKLWPWPPCRPVCHDAHHHPGRIEFEGDLRKGDLKRCYRMMFSLFRKFFGHIREAKFYGLYGTVYPWRKGHSERIG